MAQKMYYNSKQIAFYIPLLQLSAGILLVLGFMLHSRVLYIARLCFDVLVHNLA